MNNIGIKHIKYFVPDTELTVDDLLESIPADKIPIPFSGKHEYAEFIRNELKVNAIRVETTLKDFEMLTNTVEKLIVDEDIEPDKIDLILLAQEPGQRQKKNLAQYIQYEFDIKNAYIINVSGNSCANIDHALTLANNIAKGNNAINNILILGNVKIEDPVKRLVGTYGLISDGSGVMLVTKEVTNLRFVDSSILSSGRFHHAELNQNDFLILLKFYNKCIDNLLQKTGVQIENIKDVIIQNANPMLITQSLKHFGIDSSKIFSQNRTRYAHVDCLDFVFNLKDLINSYETERESLILSFGLGISGSFISSLLSYNK